MELKEKKLKKSKAELANKNYILYWVSTKDLVKIWLWRHDNRSFRIIWEEIKKKTLRDFRIPAIEDERDIDKKEKTPVRVLVYIQVSPSRLLTYQIKS